MIRLLRVAAFASIALISVSPLGLRALGQQPRTVSGLVEVEDNGRRLPVRRAAVTLTNDAAKPTLKTFTDNDGRFRFSNVSAGRYRVEAAKPGFLQLQSLALSETDSTANIRMQWAAALEGRFIEDTGKPIPGLVVRAWAVTEAADGQAADGPRTYAGTTDDLGRFRIHTVPPGRYRVYATPPPPASGGRHFYPGTENIDNASSVTVVSGQTLDNLMVVVPTAPLSAIAAEAMATAELDAMGAPTIGNTWGQISGRVTRTDSGQPILNAAVKLGSGSGALLRTAWTNGDGGYVFTRVMAGSYQVTASADGHVSPDVAPDRPLGNPTKIALGDGEKLKKDLALMPLGAIEGRVVDEFGDGVPDVKLQVAQRVTTAGDGEARFLPVRMDRPLSATDDRGWFRASGLAPGDYYVVAIPSPFSSGPAPAPFPLTYLPGTTSSAAASTVRITAGIDAHGVNLTLGTANSTTIRGIAADQRGRSQNTSIALLPVEDGHIRITARLVTTADEAGRFSFPPIPEGSYVLQAGGGGAYGSALIAVTASTGPELNVQFTLQPLGTLRGRVSFEGEPAPPRVLSFTYVRLQPTEFTRSPPGGVTEAGLSSVSITDLTFSMKNIAWPGLIRLGGVTESDWTLARVLLNGRDITDTPYDFQSGDTEGLEVVMTNRVGGIAGTVIGADETPNVRVTVFGADSDSAHYFGRTMRSVPITKTGTFRIGGLLPGRYFAIAMAPQSVVAASTSPSALSLALKSQATLIVVSQGADASVRLTVVK